MAKRPEKSIDEQIADAEARVKRLRRQKLDAERDARIAELEARVEELSAFETWAKERKISNSSDHTVYDLYAQELAAAKEAEEASRSEADEDSTDA